MKKIALLVIIVSGLCLSLNAENGEGNKPETKEVEAAAAYSLKGNVYDILEAEALSGATIIVDGKKYYSDLAGNFSIPALSKGKHKVTVDFVSYQMQEIEVDLSKDKEIKIEMKQQ